MKRNTDRLSTLSFPVFLLLSSFLLVSCGGKSSEDKASASTPAKVHIYKVESRSHASIEEVPGTVQARLKASIEAKIPGRIEKMLVVEGQSVKEGDLLVQLDVKEIRAKYDQAVVMRDQLERDLQRSTLLIEKQAISKSEFENIDAKTKVARAAVTEADTMLGYAAIRAPFSGVITKKLADVGDLAIPGRPLIVIEDPSDLRFEANIPETYINSIKPGTSLDVQISGVESSVKGSASEISPTADPNSRTFLVKFTLSDQKGLRSGLFGHVSVPSESRLITSVPQGAIVKRGQMEIVYILRDGKAWIRLVRSGRILGPEIEILSGLDNGETVAVDNLSTLKDGISVEVLK